jgi:hypothetical protein
MLILRDWQNFFMLTGTASATLIGLLFLAVSIGTPFSASQTRAYLRTFVSPILLSYSQVLLLSCLALMPLPGSFIPGILLLIPGCFNSALALKVCWRILVLHRDDQIDLGHWIWHIVLPLLTGLLLGTTAIGFLTEEAWAPLGFAVTNLLFLALGLRNTWVLTIWLLLHRMQENTVSHSEDPDPASSLS